MKIILVMSLLAVLSAGLHGTAHYFHEKKALIAGLDEKLLTAAHMARDVLPADYHDRIVDADSVSSDKYRQVVRRWDRLCETLDLEYIWSLIEIDGQIVFTSGSSTSKDVDKGDHAAFFEPHSRPESYAEAMRSEGPHFQVHDDRWGRIRAVLIPAKDVHGRPYLIGASMKMTRVDAAVAATMRRTIGYSGLILGTGLVLSVLVANSLTRPIEKLTDVARRITHGEAVERIPLAGSSEIVSLAESFDRMQQSVQDRLKQLNSANASLLDEIGQREQVEDALRKSQALFAEAFSSNTSLMLISTVAEGRIVEVNQAFSDVLGYARGELVGRRVGEVGFYPPGTTRDEMVSIVKRDGRVTDYEMPVMSKMGIEKTVLLGAAALEVDGEDCLLISAEDITERKRIEQDLASRVESLTQPLSGVEGVTFEDLFDIEDVQRLQDEFSAAIGIGSIITRVDGEPITAPSNFCRFCKDIVRKTEVGFANCRKSDAILGRYNPDGPTVQPCLSGGLWDAGASISVGGKHVAIWLVGQVRDETQNEESIRAYAHEIGVDEDELVEAFREVPAMSQDRFRDIAQAMHTLADQLSRAAYQNVLQARFIAERKRAEAEREMLEDQLRQSQKMEAIGQLAGGVAHDFNNILQAILGYSEMALADVDDASPLKPSLDEILKASLRAKGLVSQLLAFSRRQVLEMEDLDLNEVIADLMKMLRRVIGEHIALDMFPGHDLGTVRADRGQIAQILTNLCVNAQDAIGQSGSIAIETENVQIDQAYCDLHTWSRPGRYVLISVTDNGCGMDAETAGRVFEPFFTTKGPGKGTGLGLSTVYGLVKQHDGQVEVYSEVGKGTTFKVYLPLVAREAKAVEDHIERPIPGGDETILLAEDDEMVLSFSRTMLESAGYSVLTARDGVEALALFEKNAEVIDLAILDVVMPKLGGRAVYDRIRETKANIPVLFASGYSPNAVHTNFILDEGLTLLQKPFGRSDLLGKIREVLAEE